MGINFEVIKISPLSTERIDYATLIFKADLPKKVDIDNSKDIWIFFKTFIDGGVKKIFIDMKQVEYIDSSGIGIIINAAKLIRKQKGDLVIANVSDEIREIFKVISLENFIKVYNNEVEALKALKYIA